MQIIPAILTNDPKELEEKILEVAPLRSESFGGVKRVQVDIIDGVFANNRTVGLEALEGLEVGPALDIHLMVKEPVDWVEKSIRAMGDRIIGQVEMMSDQFEFATKVQETGHKVGLALDLGTPVSKIENEMLKLVDVVLLMSVKAGFGGQEFTHSVLAKISELSDIRGDSHFRICVDGGESPEHVKETQDAGADEIVVGSSLFEGDIQENMNKLQEKLK